MWNGEWTEELNELFRQYRKEFGLGDPDEYDEICYDAMTYEEFVAYIRLALERRQELPDVVE